MEAISLIFTPSSPTHWLIQHQGEVGRAMRQVSGKNSFVLPVPKEFQNNPDAVLGAVTRAFSEFPVTIVMERG